MDTDANSDGLGNVHVPGCIAEVREGRYLRASYDLGVVGKCLFQRMRVSSEHFENKKGDVLFHTCCIVDVDVDIEALAFAKVRVAERVQ